MQQEQIKTLLMNILTWGVIAGVFIAGYFVFIKKETEVITSVASVAKIAEETASIGVEIDATVSDLEDLSDAIAQSKVIFDLPAFIKLNNFSAIISKEHVGRANPFVPTVWKLNMKSREEAGGARETQQTGAQSALIQEEQAQNQPAMTALDNPFGDFNESN